MQGRDVSVWSRPRLPICPLPPRPPQASRLPSHFLPTLPVRKPRLCPQNLPTIALPCHDQCLVEGELSEMIPGTLTRSSDVRGLVGTWHLERGLGRALWGFTRSFSRQPGTGCHSCPFVDENAEAQKWDFCPELAARAVGPRAREVWWWWARGPRGWNLPAVLTAGSGPEALAPPERPGLGSFHRGRRLLLGLLPSPSARARRWSLQELPAARFPVAGVLRSRLLLARSSKLM